MASSIARLSQQRIDFEAIGVVHGQTSFRGQDWFELND
jgi:hypothetical protein